MNREVNSRWYIKNLYQLWENTFDAKYAIPMRISDIFRTTTEVEVVAEYSGIYSTVVYVHESNEEVLQGYILSGVERNKRKRV